MKKTHTSSPVAYDTIETKTSLVQIKHDLRSTLGVVVVLIVVGVGLHFWLR